MNVRNALGAVVALGIAPAAAGCGVIGPAPPLSPQGASVKMVQADEQGDEWLHDHCVYTGTIEATSSNDARNRAAASAANVLEPVLALTAPDTPSFNGIVAYEGEAVSFSKTFACKTLPGSL
jgi:hypothetical protein